MQHLNRTLSVWEVVLDRLGRRTVCWRGNPLSERDQRTFTEAIVMCALHLTDLSSRYGGVGLEREIIAWALNVSTLDVSHLASFLSEVVVLLRNVVEPTTYSWFKHQLRKTYPFVGEFCAPIKEALSSFLEDPNPRGFYVCYQFFSFLTHLSLVDLDINLEDEYCELECNLQVQRYPKVLLNGMNAIMKEWMEDFSLSEKNFRPSHGPGATAELSARATQLEKYRYLGSDALIRYVFSKYADVDVSSYFPLQEIGVSRCSKVVFVPKSMKTRRTISKEPAALMYLQQGVSGALVDFIHHNSNLRSHIDLRVQAKNAAIAVRSSRTQSFATIDLSSASDTVTTTLVKAVFHNTPVYPFLVALRSRTVRLPSGKVLETAKFAPMGSALCFPIETLIFACVVEYAVRRARSETGNYPSWRVYGDDIIVQDALFRDVCMYLESLGFILNEAKSFSSPTRFRESCGGEGFDGVTVTPLKISRRFVSVRGRITASHAAEFEGLIEFANQCEFYQFSLLRAWIIRVLLDNPIAPPLFSGVGNGAIYSSWPDNFRARRRLQPEPSNRAQSWYQRPEVEVVVSGARALKTALPPDLEQARYFETLRLSHNRQGDMFSPEHRIYVLRGTLRPKLRKKWVEIPAFSLVR